MNLDGMTLLLTRPQAASERFRDQAEAALGRFGRVIVSPLMDIVWTGTLPDMAAGTVFAFTSENGAQAVARLLDPAGRTAWCVGDRTAKVAARLGFRAISAGGDVGALVALLARDPPPGPVLHVGGTHRAGDLAGDLRRLGVAAGTVSLYDQRELPLSAEALAALSGPGDILVPVFSPRSAQLLRPALESARARIAVAAISAAAAAPLDGLRLSGVEVSIKPDSESVIFSLRNLIAAGRLA